MKIKSIEKIPIHEIVYQSVNLGREVVCSSLPLLRAIIDKMPEGLKAIVATSDLQGRELTIKDDGKIRLLGEVLAEEILVLSPKGLLPHPSCIGVILAGDFFSRPLLDRRGGYGDVRPVWLMFHDNFRWVTGVAGNHDLFSELPSEPDFKAFVKELGENFLDETIVELDDLRIAGLSGIIGNPLKPFRRDEATFVKTIDNLIIQEPDIFIMHQNSDAPVLEKDVAGYLLDATPRQRKRNVGHLRP